MSGGKEKTSLKSELSDKQPLDVWKTGEPVFAPHWHDSHSLKKSDRIIDKNIFPINCCVQTLNIEKQEKNCKVAPL